MDNDIKVLSITLLIFLVATTISLYYGSCREAKIYNQLHETDFNCGDFFWAGDQINEQTRTIKLETIKLQE